MSIFDIVRRVRQHMMEEHRRLSYPMLRREFSLDDETFDAVDGGSAIIALPPSQTGDPSGLQDNSTGKKIVYSVLIQ